MAYDARTLKQTAVFKHVAGFLRERASGRATLDSLRTPKATSTRVTGNGKFDAASGGRDYGDTVLKLALANGSIVVRDYFTPFESAAPERRGSGCRQQWSGPAARSDWQTIPNLLVTAGKEGRIYVIDRDRMGKFQERGDSHAVQTLPQAAGTGAFGAPAYWNGHVYFLGSKDVLKDWAVAGGRLSQQPVASAAVIFTDPGATPTVSANGSKNGIVWVVQTKPGTSEEAARPRCFAPTMPPTSRTSFTTVAKIAGATSLAPHCVSSFRP